MSNMLIRRWRNASQCADNRLSIAACLGYIVAVNLLADMTVSYHTQTFSSSGRKNASSKRVTEKKHDSWENTDARHLQLSILFFSIFPVGLSDRSWQTRID